MNWISHYLPPDSTKWQGKADTPPASCFFQIIQLLNLTDETPIEILEPTFALIGFRCDEGIRRNGERIGAAEGSTAIRQALAKLPVQKQTFSCVDAGNIICIDENLEEAQYALGEVVELLLRRGMIPIVIGGGHELAWGHYQGIASVYPKEDLGIINFDSRLDLYPLLPGKKGSSATALLQIAEAHKQAKRRLDLNCIGIQHAGNIRQLFETAKSYNTKIILADEFHQGQIQKCVDFVDRVIDENDLVYVSLCLDVFAASFAPGVNNAQPLGLLPWDIIELVRQLAASGKVVSYDIAELCPRYDIDHNTSRLAAILIYEIIHHHSSLSHPW